MITLLGHKTWASLNAYIASYLSWIFHTYFIAMSFANSFYSFSTTIVHQIINFLTSNLLQINIILYNSPTFRKLFPEYMEKYNQQQQSEQLVAEQASPKSSEEGEGKHIMKRVRSMEENINKADGEDMKKNRKQSFPTWLLLLLFSIFGVLMALPLLQPWNHMGRLDR